MYSYTTTGTDDSEKINASSAKYNGSTSLSSSYSYDDNGNVLTKSYGENTSITNTYDSKGRITSTTYSGKTTNYTYDSNGQLLSANDDTYAYDSRGNITSKTESGTPLGFVLNGTQYFYITNQMGDILAITDADGSIVGNYEYDAWGKVLTVDTDIAKQNPIRYRGYYYDNETGYYYLQSRYYDSNICRFINADIPERVINWKHNDVYLFNISKHSNYKVCGWYAYRVSNWGVKKL